VAARGSRRPGPATRRPSRRAAAAGVLLAAGLALAGWTAWRRGGGAAGGGGDVRRDPSLSVLLITVDTLRADALGSYGHAGGATPVMDRLAASGVRFTSARAHNVVTLPSHANILTGRLPTAHGIRDNAGFRLADDVPTLATILKERGYRTAAFVSAFPLDSRFGLARGFDVYDDRLGGGEHTLTMQERRGRETVAAAKAWRDAQPAPTFLWVHVYDPHFPYAPPEPFAARFAREPYQGEVAETDDALGPLLRPLLEDGDGRTLTVLTADHGESLGEHEEETHGIFAYEATLRVPLILHQPLLLAPRVVEQPVRHVDLLPTVLDALALPVPQGLTGRSLLAVAAGGKAPPSETYFEALSATLNRGWAPLHGVVQGHTKYVELPLPELYDLAADPAEARNLAASEPRRLAEMRALLRRLREGDVGSRRRAEDAETRERLRALGYLAASTAAPEKRYAEADDPKRLMALDRQLERSLSLYARGDLEGAFAACEDLVRQRPDMALAQGHLGFLRRQKGDLAGAVAALKRALALAPEDAETAALLGVYLDEAGRATEAVSLLAPYAAQPRPDLEILNAYGIALASLGRRREALAAFERVRAADPTNVLSWVNTGVVHLMEGELPEARAAFEAALALDPGTARAHNSLGVIEAREGRPERAVEHWREAVRLDPRDYQTLFNLGMLLWKGGRQAEARGYLARYVSEAPRGREDADVARVRALLAGG
jgi:arylsulfatase A-like enzyme/Flp pilus assembly protein TadD